MIHNENFWYWFDNYYWATVWSIEILLLILVIILIFLIIFLSDFNPIRILKNKYYDMKYAKNEKLFKERADRRKSDFAKKQWYD